MILKMRCILCEAEYTEVFLSIGGQTYYRCNICQLRFLDPAQHPAQDDEYAHYQHHENAVDDAGYRRFLSRLANPLLIRLPECASGLDFGCGPGPALAQMMREAGHEMSVYDPFFRPDVAPLQTQYDFVTCTEVVEHFHTPKQTFAQLVSLIKSGGWLAIMTCFQTDDERFATWHYRLDPTHVAFYREATFRWLAATWGWRASFPAKDIALFQSPNVGLA
jgi:SAM-dependent methyltransferase